MKLYLTNFRCYASKTFEFDEHNISLIVGSSGAGKSTIFMAIQFALYGTGARVVVASGQTSCEVKLVFDDGFSIVRTRRPNRLVLNDEYTDDVAQEIINKRFGSSFNVVSYISQNATGSFIMKSAPDKLEFLERYAFQNTDIVGMKQRSKNLIAQRQTELTTAKTKLEMALSHLAQVEKPPKDVKFPLPGNNKELIKRNQEIKAKNATVLMARLQKQITASQTELTDISVLEEFISTKQCHLDDINKRLELLSSNVEYIGDEKLAVLESHYEYILGEANIKKLKESLVTQTTEFTSLVEKEKTENTEQIRNLESTLWNDGNDAETLESIETYKSTIEDIKKISSLKQQLLSTTKNVTDETLLVCGQAIEHAKKEIQRLDKEVEELLVLSKSVVYACPSCDASLQLKDNNLKVFKGKRESITPDYDKLLRDATSKTKKLYAELRELQTKQMEYTNALDQKTRIKAQIQQIADQYETGLEDLEQTDALSNFTAELKELQGYYYSHKSTSKHVETLKSKLLNGKHSYEYLENKIKNLTNDIDKEGEELSNMTQPETDIDAEELKDMLFTQRRNKDHIETFNRTKNELLADKSKNETLIDTRTTSHRDTYKVLRSSKTVTKMLGDLNDKLCELKKNHSEHVNNLTLIKDYEIAMEIVHKYSDMEKKVNEYKDCVQGAEKRYSASQVLYQKILECESIAIASLVDKINVIAQEYLDNFFPNDPISIRLLPFKETKKAVKPQINLEMFYKDMEIDTGSLSGGELSRVVLAFTMTLAEIFDSNMLLLDEPTSSLDQNTTATIFDHVKYAFKERMVLVIAHQVIEGVFDTVMKI